MKTVQLKLTTTAGLPSRCYERVNCETNRAIPLFQCKYRYQDRRAASDRLRPSQTRERLRARDHCLIVRAGHSQKADSLLLASSRPASRSTHRFQRQLIASKVL